MRACEDAGAPPPAAHYGLKAGPRFSASIQELPEMSHVADEEFLCLCLRVYDPPSSSVFLS